MMMNIRTEIRVLIIKYVYIHLIMTFYFSNELNKLAITVGLSAFEIIFIFF